MITLCQVTKRFFLAAPLLLLPALVNAQLGDVLATLIELEAQLQARVGVAIVDLETNESLYYHAQDRFPLSSTFKTLACAALLSKVDKNEDSLERRITFNQDDLVSYSPVTETKVGAPGMTLADLCEATITLSDNSAGNFILQAIDGPSGLTQFLRSIGDSSTRLDRWETELNESLPGDPRDTTSPEAMVNTLIALLETEVLSESSRKILTQWLQGNAVGEALLRAGIPDDWVIGDKTGAGGFGSRSIAGILWPPQRQAIITAIYITETDASFDDRNAAIAAIGQAIARAVANP